MFYAIAADGTIVDVCSERQNCRRDVDAAAAEWIEAPAGWSVGYVYDRVAKQAAPSAAFIAARAAERDAVAAKMRARQSALAKLNGIGLTDEEINAL